MKLSLDELGLLASLLENHLENLAEYDLQGRDKDMLPEKELAEALLDKLQNDNRDLQGAG